MTLNDARAASVEQQRAVEQQAAALNDARRALEAISRATSIQQTLLAETSKSAATQVELLMKQQQRELEQADIEAVMLFPKKPAIAILNKGPRRVANDVLYSVAA